MEQSGHGRGRSNGSGKRSAHRSVMKMESEFVAVPADLIGYIIGRKGTVIKQIQAESGARITTVEGKGFTVSGTSKQRACAKTIINQKVHQAPKKVEIPEEYKKYVIGKGRDNLRNISTRTGAQFVPEGTDVRVRGTKKEVQQAELQIKLRVAGARLRTVKVCAYIDGRNLSEDCELKLEPAKKTERMLILGPKAQYRLKPTEEHKLEGACRQSNTPNYHKDLIENALDSLHKIKHDIESKICLKADMWCHIGTVIIHEPDEADVDESWSIRNACRKLKRTTKKRSDWLLTFKEGVDLNATELGTLFGKQAPQEYTTRYDLSYLSPKSAGIRCKVWVAKPGLTEKLEEIPIPFSDVKNVIEEINFEDDATSSRCRGWLVLQSRKYLQANIIYPGSKVDCRIHIRALTGTSTPSSRHAPDDEEQTRLLSNYLSKLTFSDVDGLRLPKEKLPNGFLFNHMRCSRRAKYTPRLGFSVIVSRESTWCSDFQEEENRETTDLHLHCEEWERALSGEDWEPEVIVNKLPEFLLFVQQVQELICHYSEHE